MIFLSAQPDDTYFIWQLQVLTHNLKDLEVKSENIHILVGYKQTINPEWNKWKNTIYGTVHFIKDDRVSKKYLSSIRPNLIKKFFASNPNLLNQYCFYHDADILFHSLPFFEGMEDDRVHVSRTDYIDYSYIVSKNSRSLVMDLIKSVGIDEGTLFKNQDNTGGAQYYFKGLGYEFWNKVEKDCETMYGTYFDNLTTYRTEFFNLTVRPKADELGLEVTYEQWLDAEALGNIEIKNLPKYDFQIWTTDMWVVLWNIWLLGYDSYANPELAFAWPSTDIKEWGSRYLIFHNSGVTDKDRFEYFYKQDFHHHFPYQDTNTLTLDPHIKYDNGIRIEVVQSEYLKAIKNTWEIVKPKEVSIIFITKSDDIRYFQRVVDSYLSQDYKSKEFIILNIKNVDLRLPDYYNGSGIKLLNLTNSFSTNEAYINFDDAEKDARSLAEGTTIIRWYNEHYEPEYLTKILNA